MPARIPDETKKQVIKDYKNNSLIKDIAKHHKIDRNSVSRILNSNGILTKYVLDHDFFEKIDTEEKAYILGFITGDGLVGDKSNKNRIAVGLKKDDVSLLEKIKKILKSNHKLFLTKQFDKRTNKTYERRTLSFTSAKMRQDLNNFHLYERKSTSGIYVFPELPKDLISHYLRGLVDSDGTISFTKKTNCWSVGMSGNYKICEAFSNKIFEKLKIEKRAISKDGSIFRTTYYAKENVKTILSFLYDDASIFLERKLKTSQKARNHISNRL